MDFAGVAEVVIALGAAYVLALPLGWERMHAEHAYAGLRTFPLVSVGAAAYLLLGREHFGHDDARALQGLMTGIGFIGGGTMLKHSAKVEGVATAAAIWNTGALGAAVAYRYYALAVALGLANLLILGISRRLVRKAEDAVKRATGPHEPPEG